METNGFQTLLEYPDDFRVDLVVYDFTPGACLLAFMHKFKNPPLVSVTAYGNLYFNKKSRFLTKINWAGILGNPSLINSIIGGHQYYSYVPHYYLHYENDMSIWQCLYNFVVHVIEF